MAFCDRALLLVLLLQPLMAASAAAPAPPMCGSYYPSSLLNMGNTMEYQMQFSAPLSILAPPLTAFCNPKHAVGNIETYSGFAVDFEYAAPVSGWSPVTKQTANTTNFVNYTAIYSIRNPFVGPKRQQMWTMDNLVMIGAGRTMRANIDFHYDEMDRLSYTVWDYFPMANTPGQPAAATPRDASVTESKMSPTLLPRQDGFLKPLKELRSSAKGYWNFTYSKQLPWLLETQVSLVPGSPVSTLDYAWKVDEQERVTELLINGKPWGTYHYGSDGRMDSALLQGSLQNYSYNAQGAVSKVTQGGQDLVDIAYDNHGNILSGLGWGLSYDEALQQSIIV